MTSSDVSDDVNIFDDIDFVYISVIVEPYTGLFDNKLLMFRMWK